MSCLRLCVTLCHTVKKGVRLCKKWIIISNALSIMVVELRIGRNRTDTSLLMSRLAPRLSFQQIGIITGVRLSYVIFFGIIPFSVVN